MQNLKKFIYSLLTCTFLLNVNIPSNSTQREVKVYSGRHYNTDRSVFKEFEEETGITVLDSVSTALWKSIRVAGGEPKTIRGWGRLFDV